ncbi:MAG: ogr/Delta-like zinc finger family protein [Burkholderia gladioli]
MVIDCPSCNSNLMSRHSEQYSATLRRLYFICKSCGYASPADFEAQFGLSPVLDPNPDIALDVRQAPRLAGPTNSRTTLSVSRRAGR